MHLSLLPLLFTLLPVVLAAPAPLTPQQLADAYPPAPSKTVGPNNYYPTRLFGYDGCDDKNKAWKGNINEAYDDANKLVNADGVKNNIKWDDAAALEFFGPDALNKDQQAQIQAVLANTATVHRGWTLIPNYIHVRCDDPKKQCPKDNDKDPCKTTNFDNIDDGNEGDKVVIAYANNPKQSEDKYSEINFCKGFFDQRSLTNAMAYGSSPSNVVLKNDIRRYDSRASSFLHELFHLDLAANSINNNPNPQVRDLKMKYRTRNSDGSVTKTWEKAYGADLAKVMARYVPFSGAQKKTGYFVQRNDDNYVYFALAKYVQGKIDSYPFIPQIINKQLDGPPSIPADRPTVIEFDPDSDGATFTATDVDSCSPRTTTDGPFDIEIQQIQDDKTYPDGYQQDRRTWLKQLTAKCQLSDECQHPWGYAINPACTCKCGGQLASLDDPGCAGFKGSLPDPPGPQPGNGP